MVVLRQIVLSVVFCVSAGCCLSASHGGDIVVYTISGLVDRTTENPAVQSGESYVAEFVVDGFIVDEDPDSDRGFFPGSVIFGRVEFANGYQSEVDFRASDIIVLRDRGGAAIAITDPTGESTFLIFTAGIPFDSDELPLSPSSQFIGGTNSIVVLDEPDGSIRSFSEVDLKSPNGTGPILLSISSGDFFDLGDVSRDGFVDLLDVAPFVNLVLDDEYQFEADFNRDGRVDLLDIEPFVGRVIGF